MFEHAARGVGIVRIQRLRLAINVLDGPALVDYERRAMRHWEVAVQDPILRGHFAREVAEQREGNADLLRISLVGELTVNADSQYLGSGLREFGDISLIRLEFLGSPTGEGKHIERQYHVLLAHELAKRDLITILVG